jgi:diacylglycerol kinase
MKQNFFSISTWVMRFKYALAGIYFSFRTEHAMWVHLLSTIVVIILSIVKGVTLNEACIVCFSAGFVWASELFNTAIEKLADKISMKIDSQIKMIKDLSAAAVLVASVVALINGLIIFIPKFL